MTPAPPLVFSQSVTPLPEGSVERIGDVYKKVFQSSITDSTSIWDVIRLKNEDSHEILLNGHGLKELLDTPGNTNMFYGFDNLCRDILPGMKKEVHSSQYIIDLIVRLAESIGVIRLPNPEQPQNNKTVPDYETILDRIEDYIGAEIDFPNPFPDEHGLSTKRGIVSYRALQSLYQAWRIKCLSARAGGRIVEIGAGLGRTAYFAYKLGIRNYTLIDLALTNVSQANFLTRVLPASAVALFDEPSHDRQIRILPPALFDGLECDILVNMDSLTEMDQTIMTGYTKGLGKSFKMLWSVNHEVNDIAVHELETLRGRRTGRFPYWMRPGYVEEIFE